MSCTPIRRLVHRLGLVALTGLAVACSAASDSSTTSTTATATVPRPEASTSTSPSGSDARNDAGAHAGYESKEYAGTRHWICHPDLDEDPCRDLSTTVVGRDGDRKVEKAAPAADPPIDCFYVYPTTSDDQGTNADFDVNDSEIDTVRAQAARFASVCRVFAPAYRQVPLAGLAGKARGAARAGWATAYGDVLDAWKTYMSRANQGRGVVLIGHSQGAGHLKALLGAEVDDAPAVRAQVVSAILMGTTVGVPAGKVVGGDFEHLPGCASASETGCLVAFSSYPAARPPTEGAIFAKSPGAGREALCTDPTELAGGDGLADTVLPAKTALLGSVEGLGDVTTPFVSLPGSLEAECLTAGAYHYLGYSVPDRQDARPVDKLLTERLGPTWGLHLGDGNLPQDDLVEIVRQQSRAFVG